MLLDEASDISLHSVKKTGLLLWESAPECPSSHEFTKDPLKGTVKAFISLTSAHQRVGNNVPLPQVLFQEGARKYDIEAKSSPKGTEGNLCMNHRNKHLRPETLHLRLRSDMPTSPYGEGEPGAHSPHVPRVLVRAAQPSQLLRPRAQWFLNVF